MPYVRRFYYLPRVLPKESDALVPCEHLWKFECTVLNSILDEHKPTCGSQNSFQDLPNEEQIKQLRYKKILGTLNKMTPKKFQKLILEMGLEFMDVTYVKMLAEVIFSKALIDELYVNLYAKLCEEILSILPSESHHYFKQTLVDLCETGFDQLLNIKVDDLIYLKEDKRYTCKRKLMTMMRFIGEMSCSNTPLFNRSYNWKMVQHLIDKGDELHLEAVYFLLFTISLRSANNSWTKRIEKAVGKISEGVSQNGELRWQIQYLFRALLDLKNGILKSKPFYCRWTNGTDNLANYLNNEEPCDQSEKNGEKQERIFQSDEFSLNYPILIGIFPDSSMKKSKKIFKRLKHFLTSLDISLWKVVRRLNIGSSVQLTFAVDNSSFTILQDNNFTVTYESSTVSLKQLDTTFENELRLTQVPLVSEYSQDTVEVINQLMSTCKGVGQKSDCSAVEFSNCESDNSVKGFTKNKSTQENVLSPLNNVGTSYNETIQRNSSFLQVTNHLENVDNLLNIKCLEVALMPPDYPQYQFLFEKLKQLEKFVINNIEEFNKLQSLTSCNNKVPQIGFDGIRYMNGWLLVFCANCETANWLLGLTFGDIKVNKVVGDGIPRIKVTGFFPNIDQTLDCHTILTELSQQNHNVTTGWLIDKKIWTGNGVLLTFIIDAKSGHTLIKSSNCLFYQSKFTKISYSISLDWNHKDIVLNKKTELHSKKNNTPKVVEDVSTSLDNGFKYKVDKKKFKKSEIMFSNYRSSVTLEQITFQARFPNSAKFKTSSIMSTLTSCNSSVNLSSWKIVARTDLKKDDVILTFCADRTLLKSIVTVDFKLIYNIYLISIYTTSGKSWQEELDCCSKVPIPLLAKGSCKNSSEAISKNIPTASGSKGLDCGEEITPSKIFFKGVLPYSASFSNEFIISTLLRYNPNLGVDRWKVDAKNSCKRNINAVIINFYTDSDTFKILQNAKYKATYLKKNIIFEPLVSTWRLGLNSSSGTLISENSAEISQNVHLLDTPQTVGTRLIYFCGEFPGCSGLKNANFFNKLLQQNSMLDVDRWTLMSRSNNNASALVTFSADVESLKLLKKAQFKVSLGKFTVCLLPHGGEPWTQHFNDLPESKHNYNNSETFSPVCISENVRKNVVPKVQVAPLQIKSEQSKEALFQVVLPNSNDMKSKEILSCILNCNSKLGVANWKLVKRLNVKKSVHLVFSADYKCIKTLKDYQYRIYYQKSNLLVKAINKTWMDWEQLLGLSILSETDSFNSSAKEKLVKSNEKEQSLYETAATSQLAVVSKSQTCSNSRVVNESSMKGCKVCILPHDFPITLFTDEEFVLLETQLSICVNRECQSNELFKPRLNNTCRFGGWLLVLCSDKQTAEWLINLKFVPWHGAKLTIVKED